jgi:hypothetical protein
MATFRAAGSVLKSFAIRGKACCCVFPEFNPPLVLCFSPSCFKLSTYSSARGIVFIVVVTVVVGIVVAVVVVADVAVVVLIFVFVFISL